MSSSWDRTHRRDRLVAAVLSEIGRTGRPTVAARLRADVDAEFGDFGSFLLEVQLRWYRAFDARMDAVLENQPDDMSAAVADVWCGLADTMPASRLLLDVHAEHPALRVLHDHHRRTLRSATGVSMTTTPEHTDEAGVLDGLPRTSLPVTHLMDAEIRFRETQIFGTPVTTRMVAVVQDGTFTGPRLRGEILPGGGDWLVMGEDHICRLDIRATLLTDDGEYVYLTNTGRVVLTDAAAGRRYLAGETLRAQHMHARTAPLFETGAKKHAWLNGTVNIGFVELSRSHITYRIYTVQ